MSNTLILDIQQLPPKPLPLGWGLPPFHTRVTHTFPRLPTQDDLPSVNHVLMETAPHRIPMALLIDTFCPQCH